MSHIRQAELESRVSRRDTRWSRKSGIDAKILVLVFYPFSSEDPNFLISFEMWHKFTLACGTWSSGVNYIQYRVTELPSAKCLGTTISNRYAKAQANANASLQYAQVLLDDMRIAQNYLPIFEEDAMLPLDELWCHRFSLTFLSRQ